MIDPSVCKCGGRTRVRWVHWRRCDVCREMVVRLGHEAIAQAWTDGRNRKAARVAERIRI